MKKLLLTSGILGFSVAAFALGAYLKVAQETYNFSPNSAAGKAKCMLCHTQKLGGRHLTKYGQELKAALNGSKRMTPEILRSVENVASERSGSKFGESLRAGRLPG